MTRSQWKKPFFYHKLIKKINKGSRSPIRVWSRNSQITPVFQGLRFLVHNGIRFNHVLITKDMMGHKLGEFANTRRLNIYKKKNKKKIK